MAIASKVVTRQFCLVTIASGKKNRRFLLMPDIFDFNITAVHATVRNQIEKVFRPLTLTTKVHTKYQVFVEDVMSGTILQRRWHFFLIFCHLPIP